MKIITQGLTEKQTRAMYDNKTIYMRGSATGFGIIYCSENMICETTKSSGYSTCDGNGSGLGIKPGFYDFNFFVSEGETHD